MSQGISAEMVADQWQISREELDEYSVRSHQRAARASDEGRFEHEIVPVPVRDDEGNDTDELVTADEGIRPDSIGGGAGRAQAGVQARRRQDHRRQLLADHRRGLGGADHERGAGQRPRAAPRGLASTPSPWPGWTR